MSFLKCASSRKKKAARHHRPWLTLYRVLVRCDSSPAPPAAPRQARRGTLGCKATSLGRALSLRKGEQQPTPSRARSCRGATRDRCALDCLTELDAPFPDGWPPPFPIGFAFFCLSLLSLHSLALTRRGQRALSLEPGGAQWLLRHLLFEMHLVLPRVWARAQRAGSAVEGREWTCVHCCCAV